MIPLGVGEMAIETGRREFIAALGGAAAWPLAARAQQPSKLPTIGLLTPDASSWGGWNAAFAGRLSELGWIEGRTVAIERRWSEGRSERVAEFAAEFVQQKVDVIVTYGGAVATVKQATASIPIVFAIAGDPVGSGFVANLAHPGGNVTGMSLAQNDMPVSASNSCVMWSLISAGWQSCLMPTIPQACGRPARFRPRLAR
jgi:putative tryptophan/tyrosine transport system substrate-binding protein